MLEFNVSKLRRFFGIIEEALWLLLLAATPLVVVPQADNSYVLPKLFWAETLIVVLACLALVQFLLGRRFRLGFEGAFFAFLCYGILHAVSTFWASSRSLALSSSRRSWLSSHPRRARIPSSTLSP